MKFLLFLLTFCLIPCTVLAADVSYSLLPRTIYLEQDDIGKYLNFDILLKNESEQEETVVYMEMSIFDDKNRFLSRQSMSGNGLPGAIETMPSRTMEANGRMTIFNPFDRWPPDLDIKKLELNIYFGKADPLKIIIEPVSTRTGNLLLLPVTGNTLVEDGNHFFSHHRRVAMTSNEAKEAGMKSLTQRFALDFSVVDEHGGYREGSRNQLTNWYAYGTDVLVPDDGEIVFIRSNMKDNLMSKDGDVIKPENYESFGNDASAGNYVVIQHGKNNYSMLAHFKYKTMTLNVGDRVSKGDFLGKIGFSGDTAYPHLHFQLQDGADILTANPLPVYFECIKKVYSNKSISRVRLMTGDLVTACSPN